MFVKGEESHEANDVGQNTFDLGAEIGPPVFMFQRQLEERNHNSTFSAIGGWTVGQAGSDSPVATIEGRPTAATPDLPPAFSSQWAESPPPSYACFLYSLSFDGIPSAANKECLIRVD